MSRLASRQVSHRDALTPPRESRFVPRLVAPPLVRPTDIRIVAMGTPERPRLFYGDTGDECDVDGAGP